MKKVIDVAEKYFNEIAGINYILKNLENGRYYEESGAKMDGSLCHNIEQLRAKLNELINKIEYNKESISEDLIDIF